MTRIVLALMRFLALSLSYLLSTLAAAFFITFALFLGADATWLQNDPAVAIGAVAFTATMWFTIAQLGLLPALLLITILEFGRLSGFVVNLAAGGLCALVVMLMLPAPSSAHSLPYEAQQTWVTAFASGFVGAFTHWLLAGHRAGLWMGPPKEAT